MDLDYDLTQVKKKKDEIKRRSPEHKIKEEELKELIECQVQQKFIPSEIDYYIEVAKKKTLSEEKMEEIYERSIDVLELELCRLGLNEIFQRIKD